MFFKIGREEAHARLAAAGYRRDGDYAPGIERWIGPDGQEIGLTLDHGDVYEEEMIKRAEQQALAAK